MSAKSPIRELSEEGEVAWEAEVGPDPMGEADEEEEGGDDDEGEEWKLNIEQRLANPKPPSSKKRITRPKQHPVLERASKLTMRVMRVSHKASDEDHPALTTLIQGVMDLSGGLSQVYGTEEDEDDDEEYDSEEIGSPFGLLLVQLRRARNGVTCSMGALIQLAAEKVLPKKTLKNLEKELEFFEKQIQNDFLHYKAELESE